MKTIKYFGIAVIIFSFILFSACSGSHTSSRVLRTGTYAFLMTDSLNNPLVEGTIVIDTSSGSVLSGTYEVTKKYVDDFTGFRTMQGVYNGTFDRKVHNFNMNMNPKLADANVFVKGKYTSTYLAGEWAYSTYVGITSKGNFRAEYKE